MRPDKLSLVLMLGLAFTCQQACATHSSRHASRPHVERSYAARQRMYNRTKLFKLWKEKKHNAEKNVVVGNKTSKAALRTKNRLLVREHPEWFPGPYNVRDHHWDRLRDSDGELYSDRLRNATDMIVDRLQDQLGKPYVWGGTSPTQGFDCSGLVFYAYNKLLASKLPRTANEMYHYRHARPIARHDLKRGDLLFFGIHSAGDHADHVGVYLGDGDFIEAPRTGLNIRISHFADDFWQDHFIGARRILTANNIL
ncbi:C40 family peptidase [Atlantibacter hermannii]|uniref:C40 family peptidase n=1 Tax=Atlantibacter hermannii TaxID=565 RepID=UPI0028985478|nr:C40 family peptidase [Atlantibacter hermannii]